MFSIRALCALCLVLLVTGCAQSPTAPTPAAVPASVTIGELPSTSVPVPDRISPIPPRALGVTRFLAFGDSITWGATSAWDPRFVFDAAPGGGWPERVAASLNTFHAPQRFTVFNEGLPGELATGALTRFRSLLTSRRPEVVLLLEGINDLANDVSVSRIGTSLRQMLDAATSQGVAVVIATMFPTYPVTDPDGNYRPNGADLVPALNAEIRRIAAGRINVHVVDLESQMRDRNLVGTDGIHLTDAGFSVVASAFVDVIERAFPVRGGFE
jgi:lysophospholipase L1-like esterase